MSSQRTAVVLFNLGGPDSPRAVRPFLFNLFNDPAIIELPQPLRWLAARLISRRRAPVAREIYRHLGGRSPLLENTERQARALEEELSRDTVDLGEVRVFIAMRYWHPRADRVASEVAAFAPDRVVLLPLYPQYSATTTGSSLGEWHGAAARAGLSVPTDAVCCYPEAPGMVEAMAAAIAARWPEAQAHGRRGGGGIGHRRPRLGCLLSKPGRAAGMDRSGDGGRDRPCRRQPGAAGGGADRLRVGTL